MAINTMYCGFPLGAAGGGVISSAYPQLRLAQRPACRCDRPAGPHRIVGAVPAGVGEVSGSPR